MQQPKKALMIGLGAMGHFGAWSLHSRGFELYTLRDAGENLSLKFLDRTFSFPIRFIKDRDISYIDLVYIAVKAFDLAGALAELEQRALGEIPPCVLVVANGAVWPLMESFVEQHKTSSWNLGLSTIGVSFIEGYQIMSPSARMIVGPVHRRLQGQPISTLLDPLWISRSSLENQRTGAHEPLGLDIKWEYSMDIKRHYLEKWLVNCVLNSVCAARGYGQNKLALADLQDLWILHHEAFRWYQSKMDPQGLYPLDLQGTFERLLDIIQKTGDNENSMARDLRRGKQTESLFLAGQVLSDPQASSCYPGLYALAEIIASKEKKQAR